MYTALILKLRRSFTLEHSLWFYSFVFSKPPAYPPIFHLEIVRSPSHSMATNYDMHSKSSSKVFHEDADGPWNEDVNQLTRLGKKPVLKVRVQATFAVAILKCAEHPQRNFGFLSLLGFSCTVLVTWEGTLL